jgi:uncharacterized protein YjbI with pentapeptide repeats
MFSENNIHAWGPITFALENPHYFYPILLITFLIAAGIWWWWPYYRSRSDFSKNSEKRGAAEASLRKDLSLFYTGSVIALGIVGAVIQFQANIERDHRQQRNTLSAENAKRFDAAVAQLQNTPLSILGAISSLSELAKQDGFYWSAVSEVHEYLREAIQKGSNINRAEIHNAFLVLSERDISTWRNRLKEPFPLDFSALDLGNLKFSRLKLEGSDFQNTNFYGTILPGADFVGADFRCANFENSHLEPSYLYEYTKPTALGPKLAQVNFRNSFLNDVIFKPDHDDDRKGAIVDTTDACFEGAHLDGADISHYDVTNVSGLTLDQIGQTKFPPSNLHDFKFKPCKPFKDLCPTTPNTK